MDFATNFIPPSRALILLRRHVGSIVPRLAHADQWLPRRVEDCTFDHSNSMHGSVSSRSQAHHLQCLTDTARYARDMQLGKITLSASLRSGGSQCPLESGSIDPGDQRMKRGTTPRYDK